MSRHIADHRVATTGGRVKHFLRIARQERAVWHRSQTTNAAARLAHFLRIARGRLA